MNHKGLLHRLLSELPINQVTGYDPAVERWSCKPQEPHDIVTCLDVLGIIEIDSIDGNNKHIKSTTKLLLRSHRLAATVKKLVDGAMLVFCSEWWV